MTLGALTPPLDPLAAQADPRLAAAPAPAFGVRGTLAAWGELSKVRLSSLVLVTAGIGWFAAGGGWAPGVVTALLGTALAAFGANVLNQWLERAHDLQMERTRGRPLPSGRVSSERAFAGGAGMAAVGALLLALAHGPVPAALALLTVVLYALVYTPLKRRTSLCTQVGAVCGALPPMIGWTAVTGALDPGAWVLFAILFAWQIPHFLAIDWLHRVDYARGGFRMLSATDPTGALTGRLATTWALALVPVTLLAPTVGLGGWLYAIGALGLGLAFVALSAALWLRPTEARARRLFLASLLHLPLLLGLLVLDPTSALLVR